MYLKTTEVENKFEIMEQFVKGADMDHLGTLIIEADGTVTATMVFESTGISTRSISDALAEVLVAFTDKKFEEAKELALSGSKIKAIATYKNYVNRGCSLHEAKNFIEAYLEQVAYEVFSAIDEHLPRMFYLLKREEPIVVGNEFAGNDFLTYRVERIEGNCLFVVPAYL